jgi:hypothetical protein
MPTLFSARLPSLPQQFARVLKLLDLFQSIIRCQHISDSEHEFRYQLPHLPISIPSPEIMPSQTVRLFQYTMGELLRSLHESHGLLLELLCSIHGEVLTGFYPLRSSDSHLPQPYRSPSSPIRMRLKRLTPHWSACDDTSE